MFGKGKKLHKTADAIGVEVHRQLRTALEEKGQLLDTPEEIAFTSSYMGTFVFTAFSDLGHRDVGEQQKYIKQICDGVLPNRLWDVYQRGQAFGDLMRGLDGDDYSRASKASDLGSQAAIYDYLQLKQGVPPNNFTNYLLGRPLDSHE